MESIPENPLKDFSENNEISREKILNNLLDGTKNLDLKTHIVKPKKLASLLSLANYGKKLGYKGFSNLIKDFIITYLRYMVSYNRLSRIETIRALTPMENLKNYIDKKFTTNLD